MINYKVVEIFESINGEGKKAGQLALFIRFQKCNLNCSYCDTKWANSDDSPYTLMNLEELYKKVVESGIKNVTITGGEPLLQENIEIFLKKLAENPEINVEIETNGSINLKRFGEIKNAPSFTMDYKLPKSNMEKFMDLENFKYLKEKDTVKFVVSNIDDLERAREIIEKYSLVEKCAVYISPVFGKIELSSMVDFMKKYKMNGVNMQLQIHKIIWDPETKGV
ncbi:MULTISPECIES: putative 7-carboxy-7-deazaguanine synthase QueE [Fusobacterium]|jgi:7-carboxy-7-deazaguanine synthase|uniref:putative 7-carboxy-7-deazaguanine synthase QueE n=1 Tax=Fusobacterium TaxID=848 RepID=UPI001F236A12|nr:MULTISPECIES: putative 7-carboxy-7-deazaguanine synthase QueE [Fusobacterium]MCF2612409.1 putative 7-carboxy-7-deazaguanine synthase QueE [Fusobacterium perfoetens]MDY2981688.1 putative 7-carboxy-7-deazaguanine synthase QueE [Fusobacterium sp.]